MCLITDQKKALRAKEDIIVYKSFFQRGNELLSPYRYFPYKRGRQETIKMRYVSNKMSYSWLFFDNEDTEAINKKYPSFWIDRPYMTPELICIDQGYHSCLTQDRMINSEGDIIIECIIPKGAWYRLGFTNLIVSTDLIIPQI